MFSSVRYHVLRTRPNVKSSTFSFSDFVKRSALKVLDSEGNPYYPDPKLSTDKPPPVFESHDRKRFDRKAYADYLKKISLKDLRSCRFDNRITYVPIRGQHPDYTRAKLIRRGITPEKKLFICLEGKNIIRDALNCGLKLDKLFFTRESLLEGVPELIGLLDAYKAGQYEDHGAVILQVSEHMMGQLSGVQTPPGLMAIFAKPTINNESSNSRFCGLQVTVIGDNIRDPGNMGTLIRTSAAIGAETMICTKGCANPWESKVVRSGAGAHFRVNLVTNFDWSTLPTLIKPSEGTLVFAERVASPKNERSHSTDSPIEVRNYFDLDYTRLIEGEKRLCVIVGGETKGISNEGLEMAQLYHKSYKVNIPIMKGIDSLNSSVAGSIILFEIQRQIITKLDG